MIFGKIYTFFPVKWVFLIAITIFEIGSAICGAAPNSTALIIGRAVAGIGSAGIFSGALIIIAYSIPLEKRPACKFTFLCSPSPVFAFFFFFFFIQSLL